MSKPTHFYWLREQVTSRNRGSGCWEWPFSRNVAGYGIVWSPHLKAYIHASNMALRFAGIWMPPAPNNFALHSCDNPPCFNPAHLRWGSQQENVADIYLRGRSNRPRGVDSAIAKLTEDAVRDIRSHSLTSKAFLAQKYGVSPSTIYAVLSGRTWKHIV